MTPEQASAWDAFQGACVTLRTAEAAFKDAQRAYAAAVATLSSLAVTGADRELAEVADAAVP